MSETNSVSPEPVTTLTVCILTDGREILPDVFQNEDVAKGVLITGTHVEPRSVHALNETTFLVTYFSVYWPKRLDLPLKRLTNGWANQ